MSAAGQTEIRHVVVTGLMGAGKTSVGGAIAARLGWPVHDSDATLLAATGRTAREIRAELGTDGLHRAEARALLDALATDESDVICAAASVIEDPAARAGLARDDVAVIWLRASPAILARRFASDDEHRPIYGPDQLEVARARPPAAIRSMPRWPESPSMSTRRASPPLPNSALAALARLGGVPTIRDQ